MRYAFHGKMRSTGQMIDGFVEAANSEQAFDRLADQGIIGVHTVRAQPDPEEAARAISGPAPAAMPASHASEVILTQLVEKMNVLIGHVETLLTRPVAVATAAGAQAGGRKRRQINQDNTAQNETLKAIFQTNLELRKSIQKFNQQMTAPKPGHDGAAATPRGGAEMSLMPPPPRPRELAQPAA